MARQNCRAPGPPGDRCRLLVWHSDWRRDGQRRHARFNTRSGYGTSRLQQVDVHRSDTGERKPSDYDSTKCPRGDSREHGPVFSWQAANWHSPARTVIGSCLCDLRRHPLPHSTPSGTGV